jgi:c-di-AMP phosphodiesterase-like protein
VEGWPDAQYSFIERSVLEKNSYSDEDMSAASHMYMGMYLTRMYGYSWGFVVTPREDGSARVSARSLMGAVNVRTLFEQMQIGGGHDRAAGGYIDPSEAEKAVEKVLTWMKNNKPVLG